MRSGFAARWMPSGSGPAWRGGRWWRRRRLPGAKAEAVAPVRPKPTAPAAAVFRRARRVVGISGSSIISGYVRISDCATEAFTGPRYDVAPPAQRRPGVCCPLMIMRPPTRPYLSVLPALVLAGVVPALAQTAPAPPECRRRAHAGRHRLRDADGRDRPAPRRLRDADVRDAVEPRGRGVARVAVPRGRARGADPPGHAARLVSAGVVGDPRGRRTARWRDPHRAEDDVAEFRRAVVERGGPAVD